MTTSRLRTFIRLISSWPVKFLFSGVAFVFLFKNIDVRRLLQALGNISPFYVLLAITIIVGSSMLMCGAWRILLSTKRIHVGFHEVVRVYLIGLFFAAFTPVGIGGDVVRVRQMHNHSMRMSDIVTVNAVFRVLSFSSLLVVGSTSYLIVPGLPGSFVSLLVLVGVLCALLSLLVFNSSLHRLAFFVPSPGFRVHLLESIDSFALLKHHLVRLLGAEVLLVVAQLVTALSAYPIAKGLGVALPLGWFLAVIPVARLAAFLPISPNGVGVYEAVSVFLFAHLGVPGRVALEFTLVDDVLLTAMSVTGGLVYLLPLRASSGWRQLE